MFCTKKKESPFIFLLFNVRGGSLLLLEFSSPFLSSGLPELLTANKFGKQMGKLGIRKGNQEKKFFSFYELKYLTKMLSLVCFVSIVLSDLSQWIITSFFSFSVFTKNLVVDF